MTRTTHSQSLPVYDPRGNIPSGDQDLASRLVSLDNQRVAILDNTKWNAGKLLRKIVARLEASHSLAEVNFYSKESFSKMALPELVETIAAQNDAIITAIGD